jgi:hypothetical protein
MSWFSVMWAHPTDETWSVCDRYDRTSSLLSVMPWCTHSSVGAKTFNQMPSVTISPRVLDWHSDAQKAHDWVVEHLSDLFHTTTTVKSQQVSRSRALSGSEVWRHRAGGLSDGHCGQPRHGPSHRVQALGEYLQCYTNEKSPLPTSF